METWKPVPGFEGLYEVSDEGRVRSLRRNGNILRPNLQQGYESVILSNQTNKITFRMNRLVAKVFVPNPNRWPIVRHIDGDRLNNKAVNLEWGTQAMNMADAVAHGRCGINNRTIDNETVRLVREALRLGADQKSIADRFALSQPTVSEIMRGVGRFQGLGRIVLDDPYANKRFKLTLEDHEVIKNRLKNGDSMGQIARDYGVSNALIQRINRNAGGLSPNKPDRLNPELDRLVLEAIASGEPRENIIFNFKIGSGTYYNIIKRNRNTLILNRLTHPEQAAQ